MTDLIRDTVLAIYDTVADPSGWPDVLTRIAALIDAKGCIVFEWEDQDGDRKLQAPYYSDYFEPELMAGYLDRCFAYEAHDQDIFEAHSLASDGIDLISDAVLAPSVDELKKLKNVEALQRFGILHRAAGLLNKDNTARSRFSVQLSADRGPLTPEECDRLGALLPHVAKALDLGRPVEQLRQSRQSMMAAMDRLNIGLCLLDRNGCRIQSNEEFDRQLQDFSLFRLAPNGALTLSRPQDQQRFEALKQDALNHGMFGARPRKEAIMKEDGFLCIEVTPLRQTDEYGTAPIDGFIVYSTDTSRPVACNPLPIQNAFGLTEAEFALVEAIGQGLTNVQIAAARDRSVATINAQVKSILSKTQCSNRTQFVRLMMSFGVNYLAAPAAEA